MQQYLWLSIAACLLGACTDVGPCDGPLEGRDPVVVNGNIMYGGQAMMNKACATGCHASTAKGADRRGAPASLDFDLIPVDEDSADGTENSGKSTIVKLKSTQVDGLRERQKKIVELRNSIWQQVLDGDMPPGGIVRSVMSAIFASSTSKPCQSGDPYSGMAESETREVLRNWLACGAPFVESNGSKLDKSSAAGTVGDQYHTCSTSTAPSTITLETLFVSTLADCSGCHNSALTGPPMFYDVQTLAASLRTVSACSGKPFVTPGDPDNSYMLDLLKAPDPKCGYDQMPAGGLGPLSARGIAQVEDWIKAGAPTTAADLQQDPSVSGSDDANP